MTVLGTRPEIIRLSEVIKKCDVYFDHVLVHTGQNYSYELNKLLFKDLALRKPDFYLNAVGKNVGATIGRIVESNYCLMAKEQPDAVLILGDTNSALSAISAKRLKVPIFHMEAGNRCWDWNVSEMVNRKIVDHIADVNLPYTENARKCLLSEGIDGKTIFVTGSPMREVINANRHKIDQSGVLSHFKLSKKRYLLVSAHREENIDLEENFYLLMKSINVLGEKYKVPVIYSTHPRSRRYIQSRKFRFNRFVQNVIPLSFSDYNHLQLHALCVLSDSGTLSEESAMLNFPAVLIRTSTERPEALDYGSIIVGGIKESDVMRAVALAIAMHKNKEPFSVGKAYTINYVSTKVVKIIQSYTPIVNKVTWLKGTVRP